ncbi:putative bifunctional diguanylate cyclase/phosphodiesterase [Nakamurella endophytica]|uniref:Bifunctional diguanylate cyclase/phosphodiesterase n=1 Tax=Nakamurella endophytica TaxID=1748367 RepID=A0A917SYB2_9ACTN|nr:EAL domain-containing protein [Nakamurella endophytica]GGM03680.1 bifunctional diguanylate cyclase/phosphodiesterase [Nakamurella endophytica]
MTPDPVERPPGRTFDSRQVLLGLAVVVGLGSIPLWWFGIARFDGIRSEYSAPVLIAAVLIAALYLLSEIVPLRIEIRRETLLISLTEIPTAIALLTLTAPLIGAANVVAAAAVFLIRRDTWRNILANLAIVLAESGTAVAVFAALSSRSDDPTGWAFLLPFIGIPAGGLLTHVVVGLAYRLIGPAEPMRRVLTRSLVTSGVATTFVLVGWTLWHEQDGTGRLLTFALAAAVVVAYRVYAQFLRQHTDLSRMYAFGRHVVGVGSDVGDWLVMLEQVREQLNARVAVVHLTDPDDGFRVLAVTPEGQLDEPARPADDPLLALAAGTGGTQASSDRTTDPAVLASLDDRGAWDVLVVPLRSGDRTRGYLEVRNRRSRWGRFSVNDLRLLETLGQHVATSLDNLRLVERLRHEADHDAITGMLNWRGLMSRTRTGLSDGSIGAVLLVQLGILAEVNNAVGHDRGEQLLLAAGHRLLSALGAERAVAHLESDCFAVLIDRLPPEEIEQVAAGLLDLVGQPYPLGGIDVEPQARAGVALVDEVEGAVAARAAALLQRAETALTAAQSSEDALRCYTDTMGDVFRRRFQLVTQFRKAVEQGLITVVFQPKIRLADRELVGMEALVRWDHPELGVVSPAEFVAAIEATGSIDILLEHVLEIVLAQIRRWMDRRMRIGVAVNLSVHNLSSPNFPARVAAALAAHGVPPELLTFEITESSVMAAPERSMPILQELHDMGLHLSVDDFGTGYSSLAYLRRLPIDEIKIDKSFVQGMVTDIGDLAIVRAIIELGHSLSLSVVAEGVEEEAARDALRTLECDTVQGFLIARPQPIGKMEAWLTSRTMRMDDPILQADTLRLIVG